MRLFTALLAIVTFVLAGCVPSLHGIVDDDSSVMDGRLEGVWQRTFPHATNAKPHEQWKFTPRNDEQAYRLDYTEASGDTGEFIARLTKIGDHHYLDFFPVKPHKLDEINAEDLSGFYRHHLLPVHTFIRIEQWEPTLKLAFFDLRRMDEYLKEDPGAVAHERTDVNGDLLLTASTAELRKFIARVDGEQELFTVPIILERK
ncbi:MAG: hypothetical protein KDA52_09885 [Planctomycetaceae bacterium]|nr:hypothetical protein [Planctomycetaceae bacterium]